MFMDNHRVLHARTAFDPTSGHRHLQGCYIEHDGPDTRYRLACVTSPARTDRGGRLRWERLGDPPAATEHRRREHT